MTTSAARAGSQTTGLLRVGACEDVPSRLCTVRSAGNEGPAYPSNVLPEAPVREACGVAATFRCADRPVWLLARSMNCDPVSSHYGAQLAGVRFRVESLTCCGVRPRGGSGAAG